MTESANYLFLDIAHIMGDGMTMNVLFEDINAIYAGKQVEKEKYTFYEYILDEKGKLTNDDYNRTYKINEKFKLLNNEIGKYLSKLEF